MPSFHGHLEDRKTPAFPSTINITQYTRMHNIRKWTCRLFLYLCFHIWVYDSALFRNKAGISACPLNKWVLSVSDTSCCRHKSPLHMALPVSIRTKRQNLLEYALYHIWPQLKDFILGKRSASYEQSFIGYYSIEKDGKTGDDSLTAAIREVNEENGLDILPERGEIPIQQQDRSAFRHIWLFCQNLSLDDVVLQEGETVDLKWAGMDDIKGMVLSGEFILFSYQDMMFLKSVG
mgnify:CR=1 FL=1